MEAKRIDQQPLERVRQLCLELPGAEERLSHGAPSFFAGRTKAFVMYLDNHHGDGRLALWCKAPPGMQQDLLREDPVGFFVPPYVGARGWIGVRLDRDPDWERVAGIIALAYDLAAPKRLRRPR